MIEPERNAPDLEDLAAYLDGRLSDELKARVEERLARDEDYYEVFLENVRFQQEEESRGQRESGGGEVVAPAAWWRSRPAALVAAPTAAAAVLVAAIGLQRLMSGPSIEEWMTKLDAQTVVRADESWEDPGWDRTRGGADPELLRRQELAFRIGTRTVDLRVALAAGQWDAARRLIRQLASLTDTDDYFILSAEYAGLESEIDAGNIDVAKARAAEIEVYLGQTVEGMPEAGRYALGRWNETGRLAALASDAEVLTGLYRQRPRGVEEIEPFLADLEKALEPSSPDFAAAGRAFSEIATKLAGRG